MQTQSIVRASAQAVTITTLTQGDIYKRLVEEQWTTNKYRAVIGIVQSVDFNGDDAMISALEISEGKVESKVFGNDSDLKLFAVSKDEATVLVDDQRKSVEQRVESARNSLAQAEREHRHFLTIVDYLPSVTEAATNRVIEGGAA
jgi:hypothetical protein